jgi:hypothetical protein
MLEELLGFRVIRVCGYFSHCYISLNLFNKMCGRLRNNKKNNKSNMPPLFLSKPFMQTQHGIKALWFRFIVT